VNRLRGSLKVAAVKAPSYGDLRKNIMEDIAILTGGMVITQEKGIGLEQATLEMLGQCERITIDKESTTIVGGLGKQEFIQARVESIKKLVKGCDSDYDREKLQERLAKLAGGVAVLYVGAASEVEMKEKKDRVDDALSATRAAVEEGIIPGGGVMYIRAIKELDVVESYSDDFLTGVNIVKRALEEPLRQIVANSGKEGAVVVDKVMNGEGDYGYNARNGKYQNLLESGVIDPAKVARVALENAASIAGMFLTTECVLINEPEENVPPMPPMGGGMPGMM